MNYVRKLIIIIAFGFSIVNCALILSDRTWILPRPDYLGDFLLLTIACAVQLLFDVCLDKPTKSANVIRSGCVSAVLSLLTGSVILHVIEWNENKIMMHWYVWVCCILFMLSSTAIAAAHLLNLSEDLVLRLNVIMLAAFFLFFILSLWHDCGKMFWVFLVTLLIATAEDLTPLEKESEVLHNEID